MHTLEFPTKSLKIEFPSEWDECTNEQKHFLLENAFKVMNGIISIADYRIKVFSYFTGLRTGWKYLIRKRLGLSDLINERIFLLSQQLCDWIFVRNDEDNFELNYQSIKNCFPVLDKKYYGPDDLLSNITLYEFKSALSLLDQYFESREDEEQSNLLLNYFIATIYRPKYEGDERVSLHNYIMEPNLFEKVPLWQKQAIAIWFSFCVKCLQVEDIIIDGIEVNLSVLFPEASEASGPSQKVNLGWTGVIMDIAESGVFGDASSTGKTLLYDVLLYLLKKQQDQPKQK